ncbi:MAG: peptide chain release factor-like protein [Nitrospirae bacterium CG_4_9_14_3_um_filter_53_35]|nr:MAG: peptide chain release factor-like protein [Nitrospirae bacterium CG2_30_53_67]PIS37726.1 MAG: peptide chain release factor-like protein [Nitrospirae bacterium CG08_land_8_20_14_0_20_52_24]PIV82846.1 MAG: peptide chain release factor-like protein [Nitrospirae bacterium CG17_big_fil_post_rev_8_21_14_2_50_50_9]PIW86214.1 MAG: peptide chain release factor-like protein [Nitrospirae bacterium CG_4_8_14_3_um_filter_50_41]PIX85322.1 MAG: peptide chain release factor-like protein [Nitrospirae ba
MAKTAVRPEKQDALKQRMEQLGIFEKDILEKFVRSQGKGGQNVNKTSTCVYLKHLPTGIEVKCQKERSQSMNRFFARRVLTDKFEERILKKKSERVQEIEKIRRQKRKRSKRAKEKVLEQKKIQADKKRQRKAVQGSRTE